MGNSQSSSIPPSGSNTEGRVGEGEKRMVDEQVIRPKEPSTSVQFSPALIQQLDASGNSPAESADSSIGRSHHDSAIMERLAAETARLRHEESQIMSAISAALEKENMDKEKPGMSSQILSRDLEEVRAKVEKLTEKRNRVLEGQGETEAQIRKAREEVVECYSNNPERPLDCWHQVEAFKENVGKLEQEFVASLR